MGLVIPPVQIISQIASTLFFSEPVIIFKCLYAQYPYAKNFKTSSREHFAVNFCLRILCYIYLKYRIFFVSKLKGGKFCKLQLASHKLYTKYTQTKHETFPTMSHCIKSQQMRYFTGVARCRDRKKWDISKIPFASTNNPVERPSNLSAFNRFLLALRIALSVYSSPQANRRNR